LRIWLRDLRRRRVRSRRPPRRSADDDRTPLILAGRNNMTLVEDSNANDHSSSRNRWGHCSRTGGV
jgi:hypothetical protein